MRYERWKELTALLSIVSVLIALIAVVVVTSGAKRSAEFIIAMTIVATLTAAIGAYFSIYLSRKLVRERERRRIFVIYAREDVESARRLVQELKKRGFAPWLDIDEVLPGDVWQKAVFRALEESIAALVLVSDNLRSHKGFLQEELKVALEVLQGPEKDKSPVIPVRLSDTKVPERLAHIQWVDLFEEGGIERLERALKRLTASGKSA